MEPLEELSEKAVKNPIAVKTIIIEKNDSNTSSRTLSSSRKQSSNFFDAYSISQVLARPPQLLERYLIVGAIISLFVCYGFVQTFQPADERPPERYIIFGFFCCIFAYSFLLIDYYGRFGEVKNLLEHGLNGKLPTYMVTLEALCIFYVFVSLQLTDTHDPDGEIIKASEAYNIFEYILSTICGILGIFICIAYWDHVSFYCAHNPAFLAFIYCSGLGYLAVQCARYVHPPIKTAHQWSWHAYHKANKIIEYMCYIIFVITIFLVLMGTILLALFTDLNNQMDSMNEWIVIFIFSLLAISLMITPLAPGSAVDMCGGYVLVNLFKDDYVFLEAIAISFAIIVVLHFIGSCAQWFLGQLNCSQGWLNRELPPMMLAASDSTLQGAGCIKVGIVGQVFMDTANGLNQGRMNMPFCTQFWSEWSSIPCAASLVTLGACLGSPENKTAMNAAPVVALLAAIWQLVAASWGVSKMADSMKTQEYWTSLEKWTIVQRFLRKGYKPTRLGWKADVYRLAVPEGLYDSICSAIEKKNNETSDISSFKENNILKLKYKQLYEHYRSKHEEKFTQELLDTLVEQGMLVFDPDTVIPEDEVSFWDDANWTNVHECLPLPNLKGAVQFIIMVGMYISGMIAYTYLAVEMEEAVTDGWSSVQDKKYFQHAISSFIICCVLAIGYWHKYCYGCIIDLCKMITSSVQCSCMRSKFPGVDIETEFPPIQWEARQNGKNHLQASL